MEERSSSSHSRKKVDDDPVKRDWRPLAKEYDPVKIASINGIGTFAHDRAVIRAIQSKYVPGNKVPEEEKLKRTLIVAKLPPLVAEEEVKRLFYKYGKITSVTVVRDIVTKRSKGYAFVEFEKERHSQRAYEDGGNLRLDGNILIVDKAISRSMKGWKPRRLGGGFGGSRDSGQLRFGCKTTPWLRPTFKSERSRLGKRD